MNIKAFKKATFFLCNLIFFRIFLHLVVTSMTFFDIQNDFEMMMKMNNQRLVGEHTFIAFWMNLNLRS